LDDACSLADDGAEQVLLVNDALEKLAQEAPDKAALVKLRFFAGLSHQEAAEALGISRATADRYWSYAKVFIYCALEDARNL
jgi:DNA-directed RNA polymerase specialized sigma24 family protein